MGTRAGAGRSIADRRAACESRRLSRAARSEAARRSCVWHQAGLPSGARRIVVARALRGLADGCVSVLLPAHLLALGHGALALGALSTPTLLRPALPPPPLPLPP